MDTSTRPCRPSVQNELLHELNPGGRDPITVDVETSTRTKPLTQACQTFTVPKRPVRPDPASYRDGIDGAAIIIALCALAVFALGFVGGVWACKAGGW